MGVYGADRYSHVGHGAGFQYQGQPSVEEGDVTGIHLSDDFYYVEEFVSI